MAEPTGVLTFRDLVLRAAEKAGMAYYGTDGQGKALVPIDDFNLDRCKRIVNDGMRLFIASPPDNGWKWQERIASVVLAATESGTATAGTATTLIDTTNRDEADDYFIGWTLTITAGTGIGESATITDSDEGDSEVTFSGGLSGSSTPDTTSIYSIEKPNWLPYDFGGQVDGPITYAANTNHGTGIKWVDESLIRAYRSNYVTTGYPLRAACRRIDPTAGVLAGSSRRWQLVTDLAPVAADTLEFPYTSHFATMDCEAGLTDSGSAVTIVDGDRGEVDDYFNTWILTVVAGTGLGETATITDYTGATGTFTFAALSGASTPDNTTVYYVEPATNLHAAGLVFDDAILAACYAEVEKQIVEINEGMVELFYKTHLPNAHKLDSLSRPRTLQSKHRHGRDRYRRTWLNVTTDNDM